MGDDVHGGIPQRVEGLLRPLRGKANVGRKVTLHRSIIDVKGHVDRDHQGGHHTEAR